MQPRVLVLVGSGETASRMARVQRSVIRKLVGGGGAASGVSAAVIDTPYGFQSNADAISAELVDFFGRRMGVAVELASFRRSDDLVAREAAVARLRRADFVFSGPGSPSYALRHWTGTEIPALLADKLARGGAVMFASAAALTLGVVSAPVYEIYKSGADPHWLPGLDILAGLGISAAVIPHFDNGEGGDHDTRYCFLGERRLRLLEEQLPMDAYVLGIDEHTALRIDIDEGKASVHGRGRVIIRRGGAEAPFRAGEQLDLADLRSGHQPTDSIASVPPRVEEGEATDLARRVLSLEEDLETSHERAQLVEPLIETLLEIRTSARERGDYAAADDIRRRLNELGIEIGDAGSGESEFSLKPLAKAP